MDFLERVKEYKNQIYREIYSILIFGAVFFTFHSFLGVQQIGKKEVIFILISFVYVFLFTLTRLKGRLFLAALAGTFGVVELLALGMKKCSEIVFSYFSWAAYGKGDEAYDSFYIAVQIFLLVFLCTVLAFFMMLTKKVRLFSLGISVLCIAALLFLKMQVVGIAAAFWISFVLLLVCEIIEEKWEKKRIKKDVLAYVVWLWPVWVLFLTAMLLVPSSPEPYKWTFVKQALSKVNDEIILLSNRIRTGNDEDFEIRMSGFSEEGNLGGNVDQTEKELLHIVSSKRMQTNLYLAGVVMDTFDGRDWKTSSEKKGFHLSESMNDKSNDTVETFLAVRKKEKERVSDYLSSVELDITYGRFSTAMFFLPLKTDVFSMDGQNMFAENEETRKLLQNKKKYKDSYHVGYYQMNLNQSSFDTLLEELDRNALEETSLTEENQQEEYLSERMKAHRTGIRETFCSDVSVSEAVEEWIDEKTLNCANGYQRLKALEKAMQEMTYTTKPGELPEEVTTPEAFLDYFLIDKKEGYCTYFATAFTLLARREGYPARYVQGFCVPMKGQKEVSVQSYMSHAWCEVYFDGVGWIPFEATSGYEAVRYTPWALWTKQDVTYPDFAVRPESGQENETKEETEIPSKEGTSTGRRNQLIAIALLLIVTAFSIIFVVDILLSRRNYQKKSHKDKFRHEAERNLAVLRKLGIKRMEYETLMELNGLIKKKYEEWDEKPPVFLELYEEILYGELPVTEKMITMVRSERKEILLHLGKWAMMQEKYYLLKTGK